MKKKPYLLILALFISAFSFSQDILMENGTFNRCAPDVFYDSGGEFGPYGNNENFTTTICPQNADEFIILDFTTFSTQFNQDFMTIYDGDDTTAPILGTYSGAFSPGYISASDTNTSGCLTIAFTSNATGNTTGWVANILCATPCQDIIAAIDTNPALNGSGVISILPGDTVDFTGSATFSIDGTNAIYDWNFGDGSPDQAGENVSNTFTTAGTYTVTLTVTDNNPQICTDTETITVFVLGPNLVVDQGTYTPEELIEDILIDSPCATVSNIVSSTGIDFSPFEPNGIGYFMSDGVNFPFEEGVLLTSGDASEAEGPNTFVSDGSGVWPGDNELETSLGLMDSNNATFIQFDFVPLANSISFDFLMASEEYDMGSFECTFSDAFAFFLTDSNGVTTNLAVLPGTNTPILVTNIHPDNGQSCGGANEQYFGAYTPPNGPPMGFDGRTAVFTAQSAVVPGETYTIKLVISDDRDNAYDSGVFLKAGSFDLGGNLGEDRTIANGNAGCSGDDVILDTGLATATHTWYKDGVEINGETSSILTVAESGIYSVDFDLAGVCQGSADPIEIEFRSDPTVGTPQNLLNCEIGGSNTAEFNLAQNDSFVLDGQDATEFSVSYHLTEQDAVDNVGQLPLNYTNISNPQTIWVRIADSTQFCYEITSFNISVASQPVINAVGNLEVCDDASNDGFAEFNLDLQTTGILGGQSATAFNVTYHLDFASADAGTGVLPLNYTNTLSPQPIYVRVESVGDSNCYNATPSAAFALIVNARAIATMPDDMVACDDGASDGLATFDLSTQEADILNGQDPATYDVSFHGTQADADANIGGLPATYTNTEPNMETVYVRVEDPANPDCYGTTSFDLVVNLLPVTVPVAPLAVCDDDTDGFAMFNMSTKETEILNGQAGVAVSFHESFAEADTDTGELADGYTNTAANNQTLFVRLENTATGCYNITTLDLVVQQNPIATDPTTPLEVCDDDNDGFVLFDLIQRDAEIIGGQAGTSVSYYGTLAEAEAGNDPLPTNYTNTTADVQVIYARLENAATGCYDTTPLQLIVNPLPETAVVSPLELCDYTNPGDSQEEFDLSVKDAEILNGQVNVTVVYYENQADADATINAITAPYTNTVNPQPIVAVLTNTNTGCSDSLSFDLVVNPLPSVVDPDPLEVCDDGTPDGLTEIDLSLKNGEITANDPAYAVSYYLSQADADTATDPLPVPYTNISNPQTVFVRVEDVSTGCFDTTTLELFVEQAPAANEPDPLLYCDPDNDGFGSFTLTDAQDQVTGGAGGLTVTYHETFPNADNGVDAIDTTVPYENITADIQVIYVRIASSTIATNCPTIVELELIVEETPQLVDPDPLEACDDISADGFAQFDLTSKESEILNGQDPVEYIVSFYETEADAEAGTNAIANPTGYTNTVEDAQTVWVRVDDITTANGCYKLTTLNLIVNPLPVLAPPPPLELCDVNNPGDGQEAFTLEDANNTILNGQSGITLSYHATLQGAQDGTDEIFSPYTNTENAQTVYVRALNDITGCASTVTLTLRVEPVPTPEPNPTEIRVCDEDNDGFGTFDLESRTLEITNGEPNVVVTYHETQSEAQAGDNALVSPYTNIVANNQTIYVRSESTVTGCYSLTENTLQLLVDPSPEVPTAIADYVVCDDDDDGISQFDLTTKDMEIYNGQDPADFALTYHLSAADATSGNSPITNTTNFTNATNPQTIHVRLVSNANGCVDIGEFEIRVELPPEAIQPMQLSECDDVGERPGDEMTVFDLTLKNTEITGGEASWSVDYYETLADAEAQDNVIADPSQYTNMEINGQPLNPQTLYAVVTADTGCTDMVTLTIRVQPNPTPTADDLIPDLELCDDMNTGDGVEVFNLLGLGGTNAQEDLILNGENNVTASYYATFEDADAGTDAIADPENYTNIESPQEIYVRVANNTTGCYELAQFTIRVNPLPGVVAVTDFVQCELNTDNTASFDLTAKDGEVLNGQDPALFTVSYHVSLADAQAQVNALVSPYQNTSSPQQIFVAIRNNDTGCSIATQSFNIEVQEGAAANPDMDPIVYGACDDNMETDGDPTDDSVQFDLGTRDGEVLDGQDPASYQVSYFATQADADLNVNPLPNLYENTTNPQAIYARVDNNTAVVVPIALDLAALGGNGLDLDADGTIDTIDTDGDGVFDLVDVDGDGLSDAIDTNGDGIIEFVDVDGDGQGDPVDLNNDGTFDNQQDGSVCFDVAELTLRVNPLPVFELEDSYVLCVGTDGTEVLDPLVLDTGLSAAEYGFEWSYNGDVLAGETGPDLVPGQGGTYRVVVTDLLTGCVNALDVGLTEVGESGPPSLTVEVLTQAFAENHVIEATATGTGGDFEYSLDGGPWQESGTFTNVSPGEHTVTARDRNGCGTAEGTVTVLDYPLYFTPNGDGNNDTWQIENIGNGAKIYIFDRYGKLLKQISPSGSGWDGTYNGSAMPSSDYWFSVEYEENGQNKQFRAHFTLKR